MRTHANGQSLLDGFNNFLGRFYITIILREPIRRNNISAIFRSVRIKNFSCILTALANIPKKAKANLGEERRKESLSKLTSPKSRKWNRIKPASKTQNVISGVKDKSDKIIDLRRKPLQVLEVVCANRLGSFYFNA